MDIAKFLRIVFLYSTSGGCFWQFYSGTVKSAGVPVLWFRASTCFRFWSKFLTKHCSNNFYYHVTKQIFACLIWLVTCFRFQGMFWKTSNCFRFWWKTYTKCCTSVAQCQKTSFSCTLRLVRCFQIQGMIWKMEHSGENPYFDSVLPLFTLLS